MIQGTEIYQVIVENIYKHNVGLTDKQSGFIDNKEVAEYKDFDILSQPVYGETLNDYKNKARGLLRYKQMCLNLQRGLDEIVEIETDLDKVEIDDKKVTNARIMTPEYIKFKLIYTQPDGLTVQVSEDEYNEKDEEMFKTRDGRVFLKGSKAIERLIAQVLMTDYELFGEYFDNTSTPSGNPSNWKILPLEVHAPCKTLDEAKKGIFVERILGE